MIPGGTKKQERMVNKEIVTVKINLNKPCLYKITIMSTYVSFFFKGHTERLDNNDT